MKEDMMKRKVFGWHDIKKARKSLKQNITKNIKSFFTRDREEGIPTVLGERILDTAPVGIAVYEADGQCVGVNDYASKILGETSDQLLVQNFRHVDFWEKSGLLSDAVHVLATDLARRRVIHLNTAHMKEAWLDCRLNCFLQDKEPRLLLVISDITEQKRTEAKLELLVTELAEKNIELMESEEKYRFIAENVDDVIWQFDGENRFKYLSPSVFNLLGFIPDELLGKSILSIFTPASGRHLTSLMKKMDEKERAAFSVKRGNVYEAQMVSKSGETVWVELKSKPVLDKSGKLLLNMGTARDISGRKKAEEERERLLAELGRKNKELESIIYTASHDLRSPLLNIQGFSKIVYEELSELENIVKDPEVSEETRGKILDVIQGKIPPAFKFIKASVEKMDFLIQGLLKVSRVGRVTLNVEKVNMNHLVSNILDSMKFQLQSSGAQVEVGNLPDCSADKTLLNRVFSNLLSNAINYRNPKRPLTIKINGNNNSENIVYNVIDNGKGIASGNIEKIFELFKRLDPSAASGEGLGLALSKKIIERHGGRIWAESGEGEGSAFFIELPSR